MSTEPTNDTDLPEVITNVEKSIESLYVSFHELFKFSPVEWLASVSALQQMLIEDMLNYSTEMTILLEELEDSMTNGNG